MNKRLSITFGVLAVTLAGCASPAMHENMVAGQEYAHPKLSSKFYKAIKSTTVEGGSETNPIWTSQVSSENFQMALNESLKKAELMSDSGQYDLSARLVALKQPIIGFKMTVRATVDYTIKDRATKAVIFDETIESAYTARMSDTVLGVKRLRLANEGAIKNNIELLLQKIS